MAANSTPIRVDREIYESAKAAAEVGTRSIPQQVGHWARIGRALEMSQHVSTSDIERVLTGDDSYDGLSEHEQAVVRARWDEISYEHRQSLNLEAEFRASGRQYSGLDEAGQVVVHSRHETDSLTSA